MPNSRSRPGQAREHHRDRLARPEYERLRIVLERALGEQGVSQRELSKRLGLPSSFVNKVMKGNRPVELTELVDIALALGMKPAELFALLVD